MLVIFGILLMVVSVAGSFFIGGIFYAVQIFEFVAEEYQEYKIFETLKTIDNYGGLIFVSSIICFVVGVVLLTVA